MIIYANDVDQLLKINSLPGVIINTPALLGAFVRVNADGSMVVDAVRVLEVNILDSNGQEMGQWEQIQVCIHPGDVMDGSERLDGPWARHKMYIASSPDCSFQIHVSNQPIPMPVATAAQMSQPLARMTLRNFPAHMNPGRPAG